jgi:hypothetical protein
MRCARHVISFQNNGGLRSRQKWQAFDGLELALTAFAYERLGCDHLVDQYRVGRQTGIF